MAEVRLESIVKTYPDGFNAVKGIDLTIHDRELMVLVGPSGCGKSTTLRMIAGLESISGGSLTIDGERVNEIPARDRDIAMVFQSYALYPHMSVRQNMGFALKLRKESAPAIRRKVDEAAEILDIGHLLGRKPSELSGGQMQRVALGRAIVRQPKVFLLDEPLSNLDAKLRTQMRAELSRLHQQLQATMIYVTHDQIEAMTMGDRITVLDGGKIQQVDTPLKLYDRPANRFVAGFIGSPPMSFLSAKVGQRDGQRRLTGDGFDVALTASAAAQLGAPGSGDVVLGIRPKAIRIAAGAPNADSAEPAADAELRLKAVVEVVEPVGGEAYLHLRVGGELLTGHVEDHEQLRAGQPVELLVDTRRVRLFDAASGAAIC